ncbi:hypothetical protein L596_001870 [Steinernema carpocapsae]|uniref:Uncharacterized protein n=1 Tax=Steinernema carpocapsae TaxID=34508 RepID=A0A4U8UQ71_STECR|nr:hypothetical protein L596_001870 [Steinernema carpocapsae]
MRCSRCFLAAQPALSRKHISASLLFNYLLLQHTFYTNRRPLIPYDDQPFFFVRCTLGTVPSGGLLVSNHRSTRTTIKATVDSQPVIERSTAANL